MFVCFKQGVVLWVELISCIMSGVCCSAGVYGAPVLIGGLCCGVCVFIPEL